MTVPYRYVDGRSTMIFRKRCNGVDIIVPLEE